MNNEYYLQILQYLIAFHNLPAWSLDLTTWLLAVKIAVKGSKRCTSIGL